MCDGDEKKGVMLQALIFDFDGLILDTETPDFIVLSEQYRRFGAELLPERWVHGLGTTGGYDPYGELEALTGARLDREALRREHRERYIALCEQQPLQPGVREVIIAARARGIRLAVASSATREWVEGWLERHAIRAYFACVRTRSDGVRVKPAPDLFLSAAACLDAPPEWCVVLEDSPNGIRAAAAAGMRCVAVPVALLDTLSLPPHMLRLHSLADLPADALLDRMASR
ncbi:HAD-superfamily hydrolase, subfamily IA, variant 3 [Roseiflexus castenholzii DSM 13941]|uniref:HAD-superfamily hydrolase, subfamily IA, variant 3 n=2 Tax=Roseiflexaceae TaxID=1508635 RepID=A7NQF9_ROSCS|nr:HAD-superfamily hydrolase, subfamily IA, variant 3 [Roseiflexus castenholzii DSM 13941]